MCYIASDDERYGKASFLTIFIIVWVVTFALSHYGTSNLYIGPGGSVGPPLGGPVIFSTMFAILIAGCCYAAGGGARNPKELMDGITWEHI